MACWVVMVNIGINIKKMQMEFIQLTVRQKWNKLIVLMQGKAGLINRLLIWFYLILLQIVKGTTVPLSWVPFDTTLNFGILIIIRIGIGAPILAAIILTDILIFRWSANRWIFLTIKERKKRHWYYFRL